MTAPGEGEAGLPLPFVGHLPSRRRMTIFIVSIVVCLGLFLITVLVNIRSSNHNAVYRATSTEMQMLSQRLRGRLARQCRATFRHSIR